MNYKIAKELKEAGFSQEGISSGGKSNEAYELDGSIKSYDNCCCFWPDVEKEENLIYIPTLSELIDACGWRFVTLGKSLHEEDWFACSGGDYKISTEENKYDILVEGNTPEETVAKLWLALNKNK
jgi:hypothetical protein